MPTRYWVSFKIVRALEQESLESHVIRKAVMRGSEEGRWKSTHSGQLAGGLSYVTYGCASSKGWRVLREPVPPRQKPDAS